MNLFSTRFFVLKSVHCLSLVGLFSTPLHADLVSDAIANIRAKYNQIEAMKVSNRTIKFESDEEPVAGTLTKFVHDGALVKANLSFSLGDHGAADETYYYDGGDLFFAFVTQSSWQFTGRTLPDGESETSDTAIEHRLYFSGGQLIRHIRKKVTSPDPSLLKRLLAKAENAPHVDPQLVSEVYARGLKAPTVEGTAALARLIFGE